MREARQPHLPAACFRAGPARRLLPALSWSCSADAHPRGDLRARRPRADPRRRGQLAPLLHELARDHRRNDSTSTSIAPPVSARSTSGRRRCRSSSTSSARCSSCRGLSSSAASGCPSSSSPASPARRRSCGGAYNPTDPTRVSGMAPIRAHSCSSWAFSSRSSGRTSSACVGHCRCFELFGVAALVATVLLFRQMHDDDPTLWQGRPDLAASFCFVVRIATVAHPGTGCSARRSACSLCAGWASGATGSTSGTGRSSSSCGRVSTSRGRDRPGCRRRAGSETVRPQPSFRTASSSSRSELKPATAGRGTPATPAARARRRRAHGPDRRLLSSLRDPNGGEPDHELRQPAEAARAATKPPHTSTGPGPHQVTQHTGGAEEAALTPCLRPDARAWRLRDARLPAPVESGTQPPRSRRCDGGPPDRRHDRRAQHAPEASPAAEDETRDRIRNKAGSGTTTSSTCGARCAGFRTSSSSTSSTPLAAAGRVEPSTRRAGCAAGGPPTSPTGTPNYDEQDAASDGTHPGRWMRDLRAVDQRPGGVDLEFVAFQGNAGGTGAPAG